MNLFFKSFILLAYGYLYVSHMAIGGHKKALAIQELQLQAVSYESPIIGAGSFARAANTLNL